MTTATTEQGSKLITLDTMLYNILKQKQTDGGDDAVKGHAAKAADVYGIDAGVITESFVAMRKAEIEREAATARANRIGEKAKKVESFTKDVTGFTPNKAMVELLNKGDALVKSLSDDDSKVNFEIVIRLNDGGNPVVGVNYTGITASTPRASTGNRTHSEKGDKSRISPWEAWERGKQAGDTFVIEKVAKGQFRDVTRNEEIPRRGLTAWIGKHYPDSKTAGFLREYGQL